mgnify:CR=1 FL=1
MNALILDKDQAAAVWGAMRLLEKVGGSIDAVIGGIIVGETHSGAIQIKQLVNIDKQERYATKVAFAAAYGLQTVCASNFDALINAAREQITERIANIKGDRCEFYTDQDLESAEAERLQIEAQAKVLEANVSPSDQLEAVQVVTEFAANARKQYAATKELTAQPNGTCSTIRVPVALLNRVRDMGESFGFPRA